MTNHLWRRAMVSISQIIKSDSFDFTHTCYTKGGGSRPGGVPVGPAWRDGTTKANEDAIAMIPARRNLLGDDTPREREWFHDNLLLSFSGAMVLSQPVLSAVSVIPVRLNQTRVTDDIARDDVDGTKMTPWSSYLHKESDANPMIPHPFR
ncbi:hypothetical protein CPB86DRAFT_802297 [Serendipita vermifera]|nr:hypothetical protein CPB86DRAFT_802297 [Serendipita vermifera]